MACSMSFLILSILLITENCVCGTKKNKREYGLTARDLLGTIAPTYKQTRLPPGFPSLDSINTDKFDYKTEGDIIKVSAKLDKPVVMFPEYVTLSNIRMNFTFNKKKSKGHAWDIEVKASWGIGSTILHVNVTPNGIIMAKLDTLELRDVATEFMKGEATKNIGIDMHAFTLHNVTVKAEINKEMNGFRVEFSGNLTRIFNEPIPIKVVVSKYEKTKARLYSVLEFRETAPEKILKKLMNQRTLNIPFFAHMMTDSELLSEKKPVFGFSFSFNEVYFYKDNSVSGDIISGVLQSHIPAGVSLLFPLALKDYKPMLPVDPVKIAFVINTPAFDFLIDQKDKISVHDILPMLSKELEMNNVEKIPNFVDDLKDAYTTHISFDSTSTIFSIFVRLDDVIELMKNVLLISVTNLVLQRNIGTDSKRKDWKVAAKGTYRIGKAKINVQYSELSNEDGKPYGLTGYTDKITLDDIIDEFDPDFFPDGESQEMIENTEIGSIKMNKVRLYSRVSKKSGVAHILLTGFTNLPQWERNIQIAVLLLRQNNTWACKWALSLKHSPLSNIIQAFTGFDSRNLKLLHNGHILTTIISSALPSYHLLPPHIITTPLLRLPVKKALSVVALLRFPDNCGDDKMCESATSVLDKTKLFTVKGVLSMDPFILKAKIAEPIELSKVIKGTNSSLQFTIGNDSRLDVMTSIELPRSNLIFDGPIHIYKTGQMQFQMKNRRKRWLSPFGLNSISFENIKLIAFYKSEIDFEKIQLEGEVLLGTQGNEGELEAPVTINYNPNSPSLSSFYANFTDIQLEDVLWAFSIDVNLSDILKTSKFPSGLMLSYSGKHSAYQLHGEIEIFGRLLNCEVYVKHPGRIKIVTENSPAPVIFAKGLIIFQQDAKENLRGPTIVADITASKANVTMKGLVKVLGIQSEVKAKIEDRGIKFSVAGKLMEYVSTKMTAYSLDSNENFQVHGCLDDLPQQIEDLLIDVIMKSSNQSIVNIRKADENYLKARKHYDLAYYDEINIRTQRDRARSFYEEHLLAYGRNEVKANDTCAAPKCGLKCFGCPKLIKCCRLDIFGHCISCSSWKSCCWKNINPLCIAKHDGCNVIRNVAERDLTEREAQLIQQKIILDNLENHVIKAEVNKGKHKAVLEAAVDAKEIVEEDSTPGLNANDAIRSFPSMYGWANINTLCYNTTLEQVATGCLYITISGNFFNNPEERIRMWTCLKNDLITEVTESIANYLFPNIIDTTSDSISEVATKLNDEEMQNQLINEGSSQQPQQNDQADSNGLETAPNMVALPSTDSNAPSQALNTENESMKHPAYNINQSSGTPAQNNDENLLDEALEAAAEGSPSGENSAPTPSNAPPNSSPAPSKSPPNSIGPDGVPKVKLINASRLGQYPHQPSPESRDNSETYQDQSSASGEEPADDELKQLYDFEASGENAAQSDDHSRSQQDKSPSTIANQLVWQEEMEDENKEGDDETDNEINRKPTKNEHEKSNSSNNMINKIKDEPNNQSSSSKKPFQYPSQTSPGYSKYPSKSQPQMTVENNQDLSHEKKPVTQSHANASTTGHGNLLSSMQYEKMKKHSKHKKVQKKKIRPKRSVEDVLLSTSYPTSTRNNILFDNPFWDIKSNRDSISTRSRIPSSPANHKIIKKVIHKRWKIPENSNGRCHVFHQLIAICKDMAETIVMLEKSLKESKEKFVSEDNEIYLELFETEEFLIDAAKRINASEAIILESGKTLTVVRQGVNIWSERCTNEFEWQDSAGVQSWLQAMDLRIQELGGYGVYRFLENLFHAFEALFEALAYSNTTAGKDAVFMLRRIHNIAESFDHIFKFKLSVTHAQPYADDILKELGNLRKDTMFC